MKSRKFQKDFTTFLLYVFGFFLLWEWLRPLEQLTDTSYLFIFLFFITLSLLLAYVGLPAILSVVVKSLFILYALHYLYFEGSFFQFGWLSQFIADFQQNFSFLLERDWMSLSDVFRSFLFFILLWLMAYLMQYWLITRKQIFIFFFMTLIYITVLDTFTPYKAGGAIIRTAISGFAVMGILTFYRLLDKEVIKIEPSMMRKWMTPLIIMIALSVGLGLALPKAEPIWPDPVPYIKSFGKESGSAGDGIQRVGYGMDDSQLGGPFIGDNRLVFRAEVETRHYWKVETKDVYTGKGWTTSSPREGKTPFFMHENVPITSFVNNDVEKVERRSTITSIMNYPHIVYPLGIKQIEAAPFYSYEMENITEKIISLENDKSASINEYSLIYDDPKFSVKALMDVESNENLIRDDYLMNMYTQLPPDYSSQVKELALQITAEKKSWYEKVKEIERYFKQGDYTYDQRDVAVPGPDEDYVEQFLFDTKKGYCDNFSTSMAVLVRSLGIPARWVKGYTEGEYKGLNESSNRIFDVTNNNAHSWVEVYFPGIGWVPFEPTQGFSNNVQFNYDVSSQSNSQTTIAEPKNELNNKKELSDEKKEQTAATSFSFKKLVTSLKGFVKKVWKWFVLGILLIALLIYIIYYFRGKWLPYYLALRFKWTKKDGNFPKAYLLLLRELGRYGLPRKEGQTLRDYADYIDRYFSSREMRRLTSHYEQFIYQGELKEGSWEETKELWENLIKKTIA